MLRYSVGDVVQTIVPKRQAQIGSLDWTYSCRSKEFPNGDKLPPGTVGYIIKATNAKYVTDPGRVHMCILNFIKFAFQKITKFWYFRRILWRK